MVSVTARKIRNHGRERASLGVGRTYAGYLISYPSVGRGMRTRLFHARRRLRELLAGEDAE